MHWSEADYLDANAEWCDEVLAMRAMEIEQQNEAVSDF
jgi:hypothetical protein